MRRSSCMISIFEVSKYFQKSQILFKSMSLSLINCPQSKFYRRQHRCFWLLHFRDPWRLYISKIIATHPGAGQEPGVMGPKKIRGKILNQVARWGSTKWDGQHIIVCVKQFQIICSVCDPNHLVGYMRLPITAPS